MNSIWILRLSSRTTRNPTYSTLVYNYVYTLENMYMYILYTDYAYLHIYMAATHDYSVIDKYNIKHVCLFPSRTKALIWFQLYYCMRVCMLACLCACKTCRSCTFRYQTLHRLGACQVLSKCGQLVPVLKQVHV